MIFDKHFTWETYLAMMIGNNEVVSGEESSWKNRQQDVRH